MDIASKIPLRNAQSESSSIFLVLSSSEGFESDQCFDDDDDPESPICMHISKVSRIRGASKRDDSQPLTSKDQSSTKKGKKEKKAKLSKSKSVSESDSPEGTSQKTLQFESSSPSEYRVEKIVKLKRSKIYRAVSIDTMQDRPCCCTPRKVDIGNGLCSALLSDIFTPIMTDQGLDEEGQKSFRVTSVTSTHKTYYVSRKQSPMNLSVCHIPTSCYKLPHLVERPTDPPDFPKFCDQGAACCPQPKPDSAKLNVQNPNEITINKQWKPGDPIEQNCVSCGRPVDGKVKCYCQGEDKMKAIRKTLCPCSAYTETPRPAEDSKPVEETASKKKICKCCVCQGGKAKKGIKCSCAQNTCVQDREEKKRCDCFTEPAPELTIDYDILKDMIEEQKKIEMQNSLKLISERTQMQSGFKVRMRKKPPTEMSVEDAIKYFDSHPEEVPDPIPDTEDCVCEEEQPKQKRKVSWKKRLSLLSKKEERSEEPPNPEPKSQQQLGGLGGPAIGSFPVVDDFNPKGFKVVVGGKGSGSQGMKYLKNLKGVCCYDILQDQTFPTTSQSQSSLGTPE